MRFRPSLALTLLALPALGVLIALGTWQVRRYGEARAAAALIEERVALPPLAEAELAADPPAEEVDWRRAVLDGRWDWERWQVVARQYWLGEPGYRLVVPLVWEEDPYRAVLVDRGWVPKRGFEEALARAPAEDAGGVVTVKGLIRRISDYPDAQRPMELGDGGDRPRRWNLLAPLPMAEAVGLPPSPWFVREGEELAEGTPRAMPDTWPASGWYARYEGRPHLQYALTWYGLAAALVGTWIGLGLQRGRERSSPGAEPPRAGAA